MPYSVRKCNCKDSKGKSGKYIVTKKGKNKQLSCHASKEKAQSAIRARYANESYLFITERVFTTLLSENTSKDKKFAGSHPDESYELDLAFANYLEYQDNNKIIWCEDRKWAKKYFNSRHLNENNSVTKSLGVNKFFRFLNKGILIPVISIQAFAVTQASAKEQDNPYKTITQVEHVIDNNSENKLVNPETGDVFNVSLNDEVINELQKLDKQNNVKNMFKKYFNVKKGFGKLKRNIVEIKINGKSFFILKGSIGSKKAKRLLKNKTGLFNDQIDKITNALDTQINTKRLQAFCFEYVMVVGDNINVYTFAHELNHLFKTPRDEQWRQGIKEIYSLFKNLDLVIKGQTDPAIKNKNGLDKEDIPAEIKNVFDYLVKINVIINSNGKYFYDVYSSSISFTDPTSIKYENRHNENEEYRNDLIRSMQDLSKKFGKDTVKKIIEKFNKYHEDHNLRNTDMSECDNNGNFDVFKFVKEKLEFNTKTAKRLSEDPSFIGLSDVLIEKVAFGNFTISDAQINKILK